MKPKSFIQISLIVLFVASLNSNLFSQSLSPERVKHIKECTVKITAGASIGTGFFINPDGTLLTCWHVIEPAIIRDPISNIIIGAIKAILVVRLLLWVKLRMMML